MNERFHEIELKLKINPNDIIRLRRHPTIRQHLIARPRTRRLVSIYYDTPNLLLLKADISLRVRRMSGGWFQSIKTTGSSKNGLHSRMEWEDLLKNEHPDFNKITEPSLIEVFANNRLRQSLKPIFITDVKRTEWQLSLPDAQLELALDVGQLQIEGIHQTDICELELELKSGTEQTLFNVAEKLKSSISLTPENTSKAERGCSALIAKLNAKN